MTFARLRLADWVAMIAALALLFATAADWYSTRQGDEARRIEGLSRPHGAAGGEVERGVQEDARIVAEGQERNAWQAGGAIDRVILIVVLAAAAAAIAAGFLRAAGRRFEPPLTPSALAAGLAALGALLVLYRIVQQPGLDEGTTIHAGAPLAIAALGALTLACARGLRAEEEGAAFRELRQPEPEPTPERERPAT
jgi:hypothetical protein